MKANLSFLKESVDKAKIELEAENKDEELMLSRFAGRHNFSFIDFRLIQASVKMTRPARKESKQSSPFKLEIVL